MLTPEQAKKIMFNERPVKLFGNEYLKIKGLTFRKSKDGYTTEAEILDESRQGVLKVPIDWLEESDGEVIETPRTEKLEKEIDFALKSATRFFEKAKQENTKAQESLHSLIRTLLEIDSLLRVEIYADDVVEVEQI